MRAPEARYRPARPRSRSAIRGRVAVALVLALGAVLAGCDFIYSTPFPDYVGYVSAERSVSGWYDADSDQFALTASVDIFEGRLFFSVNEGPQGARLLVFNEDLSLDENFALADLNATLSPGTGSLGRRDAFTFNFEPFVGNFIFSVDPVSQDLTPALDTTDPALGGGEIVDPFVEATGRFEDDASPTLRIYTFLVDNDTAVPNLIVSEYDELYQEVAGGGNTVPLERDGFYLLDRRRERLFRVSNFWD